ncbi:MAG TPA: DUF3073 domain-containing protein [Nocardioidaceae bacterium]|nr:DUF3073 domain-containing protein [Nocardioidaceae bacterium]
MGRGRAKAKQTKVARDLKYRSHETDLNALARELHGEQGKNSSDQESDDYDEWADYSEPTRRD